MKICIKQNWPFLVNQMNNAMGAARSVKPWFRVKIKLF